MTKILDTWRYSWYMQPFFELLLVVTFAYVVANRNRYLSLSPFPYYLGAFIVVRIVLYGLYLWGSDERFEEANSFLNYVLSSFEFSTLFWFLYIEARVEKFKVAIWLLGVIGLLGYMFAMALQFSAIPDMGNYLIHRMYLLESGLLIVMGTLYIISLFVEKTRYDLAKMPAFWIFSGLMICAGGGFPIRIVLHFFFETDRDVYRALGATLYSCYILYLVMILKGYRCISSYKSAKNVITYEF